MNNKKIKTASIMYVHYIYSKTIKYKWSHHFYGNNVEFKVPEISFCFQLIAQLILVSMWESWMNIC